MPLPDELRPAPIEIAAGLVFGWSSPDPLPDVPPSLTPLEALEEALVPALERGRCFVAFSGGRDSSAMLAAATHAARSRGLDDPIPLTLRFPAAEGAGEDEWQERLVAHLGLGAWERVELHDELDMLGPVARASLLRTRCAWPANGHSFAPLYEAARGGSLVTGIDGDGLLDSWQWRDVAAVLARRRPPAARDALRVARALAPAPLRRAVARRRERFDLPWLTATATDEIARRWALFRSAEPRRWDRRLAWYRGQRHLRLLTRRIALEAAAQDVEPVHPLLDARFLAAFARAGGRAGHADRTAALRAVLGGLLPERTVTRATKADFTWAFWGSASRRFAETWDGRGTDPSLVEVEAVRAAWLAAKPDFRSACLLQAAWLAAEADEQVGDARQ